MTIQQIHPQAISGSSEDLDVIVRKTCRSCDSGNLTQALDLGTLYISNFVESPDTELYPRAPLELLFCSRCCLLQLRHTTSAEWLYRQNWDKSGASPDTRAALADIAAKTSEFVGLCPGDAVLDIGCNDGTLLRSFAVAGVRRIGFEPALNLNREASNGTDRIVPDFFALGPVTGERFRVITSIGSFEGLDDPNKLIADVASVLTADGVWFIQMRYLPLLLAKNGFDAVCHQRLAYFSLASLEPLLARHGLVVADVEISDVQGGSLGAYVVHEGSPVRLPSRRNRVRLLRGREVAEALDLPPTYEKLGQRIANTGERLNAWVRRERSNRKVICGYGASAAANTLLQVFGLDHSLIDSVTAINSEFWGKYTVGTWIPVVPTAQARAHADDFLILPWYNFEEMKGREAGFVKRGGKIVTPLPQPMIHDVNGVQNIA